MFSGQSMSELGQAPLIIATIFPFNWNTLFSGAKRITFRSTSSTLLGATSPWVSPHFVCFHAPWRSITFSSAFCTSCKVEFVFGISWPCSAPVPRWGCHPQSWTLGFDRWICYPIPPAGPRGQALQPFLIHFLSMVPSCSCMLPMLALCEHSALQLFFPRVPPGEQDVLEAQEVAEVLGTI